MKIDVVYKLGIGSKHNDVELKYSLRSLSNFKDLGKVYIIGHKPKWIDNVIHILCDDVFTSCKDANLINKLILACCDKNISKEFINFSDDQVLLRECSTIDFEVPFYDNSLISFTEDQKLSRWKTRLRNTINTLKEKNLPNNCYESHIPTLINSELFPKIMFKYLYSVGQGMCANTLYFNTIYKKSSPINKNTAVRIESTVDDANKIKEICNDKLYLNYSDAAENHVLFSFLEKKFPNKSNYEL